MGLTIRMIAEERAKKNGYGAWYTRPPVRGKYCCRWVWA